LDEKLIQRVLEIEKGAQTIHEAALAEALDLPIQAEKETEALIAQARSKAEEEARQMVANAQAKEECARILADAEDKIQRAEMLGRANFDRAVSYVLARVIGRE
jgi:vacuolar-type H+-ATPase subunit H